LAAGQRKGVEELLVAVAVMKDREIKRGSPLPELQLGADLVRIELLRLGEGELCRRIEGLSVEGCSAVPLGEACVEQRLIVWLQSTPTLPLVLLLSYSSGALTPPGGP